MTNASQIQLDHVDETALQQLASRLAPRLRKGDFLALKGDLGAGKTTFARALIRALMERDDEEVPSPTFALVQPYETPRFPVHHFDFYRLSSSSETGELGLDEALASGVVIVEWPERLEDQQPSDRLEISLAEDDAATRRVTLQGLGCWGPRLERFSTIERFIRKTGGQRARQVYVNGDASARGYTRLIGANRSALLMDSPKAPDGPPIRNGKPYSQIAHLAEDVRPFIAIAGALRERGLATPQIFVSNIAEGLLLIEDFGDLTFSRLAAEGQDLAPLYRLATDALLLLRRHPPTERLQANGIEHILPTYDRDALTIETELLLDWFLPMLRGIETPANVRDEFIALWNRQFDWLLAQPSGWVLRDFHSPNLIWRPDRQGLAQLGIIDFQDAMRGHLAYDLASLLQDARIDLPQGLDVELLTHYCAEAAIADPKFDEDGFLRAYCLLGAQRATKILGIFARLARRDGKRVYLQHMPRIARYLAANLTEPHLKSLKLWYQREIPQEIEGIAAQT
jgi:tRNA threonylcarbamoyl adenosine modification protein YjeE